MDITHFIVSHREEALLVGDYGTYRRQLSRRVLTARKHLGRATAKNAKYAAKAPITADDIGKNKEYLHLLLLTAERAWAHAMHMKSTHSEDNANAGITGSTRHHIISRLFKASKYADELVSLLSNQSASGASNVDLLEARAYAYSLKGAEEFEKHAEGQKSKQGGKEHKSWGSCLTNFAAARIIYGALLNKTNKDMFKELLAGTIDPSIRYAAYQSNLPRTISVETVAQRYFPKEEQELAASVKELDASALKAPDTPESKDQPASQNVPNSISWRSRRANIVDASIGQALAAVSTAEAQLTSFLENATPETPLRDRAAAYDDVMIASQDAADATRSAIEDLEAEGVSEGDARMQDLRVTSLAVNYDLIGWRVGRNRVLIGHEDGLEFTNEKIRPPKRPRKDGKPWPDREEGKGRKLARLRERGVLFDAILQSIDSVKELPGAVGDAAFIAELDGKRAYFQALRCTNIAYSHVLLAAPQNALALFARAAETSSHSLNASLPAPPSSPAPPRLGVYTSQAKTLNTTLSALVLRYRALVSLHQTITAAQDAAKKGTVVHPPLIERLTTYPEHGVDLKNLVIYPPKLQPVPVKPIFLDVAWNYVDYPGRGSHAANGAPPTTTTTTRTAEQAHPAQEEKPAQKKGWFGFGR